MAKPRKPIVLRVRVTPEDRRRLEAAASAELLSLDTWASRAVLNELERLELERAEVPGAKAPAPSTKRPAASRKRTPGQKRRSR